MNTTTHALVALACFQKKSVPRSGWVALIGSILPDAFLAVFVAVMLINRTPADQIWEVEYYKEPWTTIGSISNSFPIWFFLLGLGIILKNRSNYLGTLITIFSLSGLSHLVLDFFTHSDDAHLHFWPISSRRFESPFSYWDFDHNAVYVMPIEGLIVLYASSVLWKRTSSKIYKALLVVSIIIGSAQLISPIIRLISE